jgi:hypothetical protein
MATPAMRATYRNREDLGLVCRGTEKDEADDSRVAERGLPAKPEGADIAVLDEGGEIAGQPRPGKALAVDLRERVGIGPADRIDKDARGGEKRDHLRATMAEAWGLASGGRR